MNTEIIWSACVEGHGDPELIVKRRNDTIVALAIPDGDNAAATVVRWWLDDEPENSWAGNSNWDENIGEDETEITVFVMVHEPASIAGMYEVHAERKVQTRGYAFGDDTDTCADVRKLLGEVAG